MGRKAARVGMIYYPADHRPAVGTYYVVPVVAEMSTGNHRYINLPGGGVERKRDNNDPEKAANTELNQELGLDATLYYSFAYNDTTVYLATEITGNTGRYKPIPRSNETETMYIIARAIIKDGKYRTYMKLVDSRGNTIPIWKDGNSVSARVNGSYYKLGSNVLRFLSYATNMIAGRSDVSTENLELPERVLRKYKNIVRGKRGKRPLDVVAPHYIV